MPLGYRPAEPEQLSLTTDPATGSAIDMLNMSFASWQIELSGIDPAGDPADIAIKFEILVCNKPQQANDSAPPAADFLAPAGEDYTKTLTGAGPHFVGIGFATAGFVRPRLTITQGTPNDAKAKIWRFAQGF